jgi:succinoglycan biosynthesis transport protein ExoP
MTLRPYSGASTTHRGPASSPLVVAAALTFVAVLVGLVARETLTGRFGGFGNDARWIREIMTSPFSASDLGYGSYSVIADLYTSLGLQDSPTTVSILGAVVGSAVLAVVLYRVQGSAGLRFSRLALVLALLTPVAIGVYQASYTKELIISLGMLVIVAMPVNLLGEIVVVAALCVLGAEYRTYWLIVAGLYVVLRFLFSRRNLRWTPWRVVWTVVALSVLTGLAVWAGAGVPADSFRTDVNDSSTRQSAGSVITRFVEAPEPVGGVLNATLTSLFFIVPVPMLLKLSPYYLVIGVLFALIWISVVRAAATTGTVNGTTGGRGVPDRRARLLARFTALPLAFLIVQGLFEPDWGSALRHASPLLPLIFGAVTLAERSRPPGSPPGRPRTGHRTPPLPRTRQTRTTSMTARHHAPADGPSERPNYLAIGLGYLRKWFWMVVVGAVVGALLGWGVSALMTKQYSATSQLYVGTADASSSSDAYQGAMLSQKQVGTYAEMATGRALGQRVADDLHIDKSAGEIASMITAGAHKDTVILDIKVTDSDADQASAVANSAAVQLTHMVNELNASTSPDGHSNAPRLAQLNEATTPDNPSSPNTTENIIIGLVLGLVVGAIAAVVRGMTDRRIRDAAEISAIVSVPSVGTISTSDDLASRKVLDFAAAPVLAAEQFRELRTNLRFLDVDNAPTILAVSSGMPSEGKSTVAANLATALADDGQQVVLVDGDLRRPRIADYVDGNVQSAVGLSTALSGDADIEDVVQETGTDNLSVVTAGPQPPNPAELLGSNRFAEVLQRLNERFDYVIVDASPVLPVTDGALVAAAADGVILAVRHGATTTDQLTTTASHLDQVAAHVLGTVFTLTPPTKSPGYHKDGYGYGYQNTARAVAERPQGTTVEHDGQDTATGEER